MPRLKLRHVGEFTAWQQAARWLAALHTRFDMATNPLTEVQTAHLLRYDHSFYRLWIQRAQEFVRGAGPALPASASSSINWLAERYDQVVERLVMLPSSLIHGEFFASNVLVQETPAGQRICAVDWEMAAIGPGLVDLAALTSGTWTEHQKTAMEMAMEMAYYDALTPSAGWPPERAEFLQALDYCHLHLAVQWLGWSTNWSPPSDEAWDWLGEAIRLMHKIGL